MTETLKDRLPEIDEALIKLSKFGAPGGAAGAGGLFIRGRGAAAGAVIGASTGIPGAATVGGILGIFTPELATAILSTPGAIIFLSRASQLGQGVISAKSWEIAGQIAAQGVKVKERGDPGFTKRTVKQGAEAVGLGGAL